MYQAPDFKKSTSDSDEMAKRKRNSNEAIRALFGVGPDKDGNEPKLPQIAVSLSGGGWRAMSSGAVLLDCLSMKFDFETTTSVEFTGESTFTVPGTHKLLDTFTEAFGLSGGSWCLAAGLAFGAKANGKSPFHDAAEAINPWLSGGFHDVNAQTLYAKYQGLFEIRSRPRVNASLSRARDHVDIRFLLLSRFKAKDVMLAHCGRQTSRVHNWSDFLANNILGGLGQEDRMMPLYDARAIVDDGRFPFTTFSAITHQSSAMIQPNNGPTEGDSDAMRVMRERWWFNWIEVSPYGVKFPDRDLFMGASNNALRLHYFTRGNKGHAANEITTPLIDEKNVTDLNLNNCMGLCGSALASHFSSNPKKKNPSGVVPHFDAMLTDILARPEDVIRLRDAGLHVNVPIHPMTADSAGRNLDVMLVMDASSGSKGAEELFTAIACDHVRLQKEYLFTGNTNTGDLSFEEVDLPDFTRAERQKYFVAPPVGPIKKPHGDFSVGASERFGGKCVRIFTTTKNNVLIYYRGMTARSSSDIAIAPGALVSDIEDEYHKIHTYLIPILYSVIAHRLGKRVTAFRFAQPSRGFRASSKGIGVLDRFIVVLKKINLQCARFFDGFKKILSKHWVTIESLIDSVIVGRSRIRHYFLTAKVPAHDVEAVIERLSDVGLLTGDDEDLRVHSNARATGINFGGGGGGSKRMCDEERMALFFKGFGFFPSEGLTEAESLGDMNGPQVYNAVQIRQDKLPDAIGRLLFQLKAKKASDGDKCFVVRSIAELFVSALSGAALPDGETVTRTANPNELFLNFYAVAAFMNTLPSLATHTTHTTLFIDAIAATRQESAYLFLKAYSDRVNPSQESKRRIIAFADGTAMAEALAKEYNIPSIDVATALKERLFPIVGRLVSEILFNTLEKTVASASASSEDQKATQARVFCEHVKLVVGYIKELVDLDATETFGDDHYTRLSCIHSIWAHMAPTMRENVLSSLTNSEEQRSGWFHQLLGRDGTLDFFAFFNQIASLDFESSVHIEYVFGIQATSVAFSQMLGYLNHIDRLSFRIRGIDSKKPSALCNEMLRGANREESVRELLKENDVDVMCRDKDGNTPLHLAVQHRSALMVEILIDHANSPASLAATAYVCLQNKAGQTALHCAARLPMKSKMIASLLKVGGASLVNIEDNNGLTALHLHLIRMGTRQDKREDLLKRMRLLVDYGAVLGRGWEAKPAIAKAIRKIQAEGSGEVFDFIDGLVANKW